MKGTTASKQPGRTKKTRASKALPSPKVMANDAKREKALRNALAEIRTERRRAMATSDARARERHEQRAAAAFVKAVALTHMPKPVAKPPGRPSGRPRPPRPPRPFPPAPEQLIDLPLGVEVDTLVGNRLQNAFEKAGLWRYEYLLEQARKVAKDAATYEQQILTVLQMALAKGIGAQQLLGPVLSEAVARLQSTEGMTQNLTQTPEVQALLQNAASQAMQYLLLELILVWFIENDVIEFWIGLFQALVNDIAGFDTNLGHTRSYLQSAFAAPGLQDLVNQIGTISERSWIDGSPNTAVSVSTRTENPSSCSQRR